MSSTSKRTKRSELPREAFEDLVRRHHLAVFRSAVCVTRSADDAEDVAQQVFLGVLEGRIELRAAEDPARVLRWWAVRTALARLRGASNARRRDEAWAMQHPERTDDRSVETNEERAALARLVAELPADVRVPVELHYREQWTLAEIGAALELSAPSVHERVRRGLEALRRELGRLGFAACAANLEVELARDASSLAAPAGLATKLLALHAPAAAAVPAFAVGGALVLALAVVVWAFLLRPSQHGPTLAQDEFGHPLRLDETTGRWIPESVAASLPRDAASAGASEVESRANAALAVEDVTASASAQEDRRAHLAGRVVDDAGLGVGGVLVRAAPSGKGFPWLEQSGSATTRPDGAFELDLALHGERETLEVDVEDDAHVLRERPVVRVSAGETLRLDALVVERIALDPPGEFVLALRVVDPAGAPLAGLPTRLFRRGKNVFGNVGEEWEAGGLTGADGTIDLAGHVLGEKRVVLDAREHGWRLLRERVTIAAPGRVEFVLRAERGAVLAGHVRAQDGAPLEGLTITARPAEDGADGLAQATTDASGRFEIVGLEPVRTRLHAEGGGYGDAELVLVPSRTDVELHLKLSTDASDAGDHMAELHGRLVRAGSGEDVLAPYDAVDAILVESATRAEFLAREAAALLSRPPYQTLVQSGWTPPPPTSAFHLTGLRAGRWVLVARVAGRSPAFAGPFELDEHGVRAGVVLELAPPVRVSGRVLDARGEPVADAVVVLSGAGEPDLEARDAEIRRTEGRPRSWFDAYRCDAEGRFAADAAPGIGVRVLAFHRAHAPAASGVCTVGDAGLELDVRLGPRR